VRVQVWPRLNQKEKKEKTGKGLGIRNVEEKRRNGKDRGRNGAWREEKRQTQLNPFYWKSK